MFVRREREVKRTHARAEGGRGHEWGVGGGRVGRERQGCAIG